MTPQQVGCFVLGFGALQAALLPCHVLLTLSVGFLVQGRMVISAADAVFGYLL